ncbi:MAG TPA: hypothetical protein VFM05_03825, partial [Candidatus Saccharimonadales bacterium]|nr:hypothetical protein [Candidatus Saccharimonadales bacterium]
MPTPAQPTTTPATPSTPAEPQTDTNTEQSVTPASFEEFLNAQPEEVKALYQSHNAALLNSVKATRDERDALKKQVKDLAKGQTEG